MPMLPAVAVIKQAYILVFLRRAERADTIFRAPGPGRRHGAWAPACKPSCATSGARRITGEVQLLSAPIAGAEFIALDTETNGLAGDDCELTEVGAVLVGGGELHDRWSSLVQTSAPLRRGIQRFTGITQAMVDGAPRLEAVLPTVRDLLDGRVMVAHNAPFDRRVPRQAFA